MSLALTADVWVFCKGVWVEGATVGKHLHNYRFIKVLQRCCFEHGAGRTLLVGPSHWSVERPTSIPASLLHIPFVDCEPWSLAAAE